MEIRALKCSEIQLLFHPSVAAHILFSTNRCRNNVASVIDCEMIGEQTWTWCKVIYNSVCVALIIELVTERGFFIVLPCMCTRRIHDIWDADFPLPTFGPDFVLFFKLLFLNVCLQLIKLVCTKCFHLC